MKLKFSIELNFFKLKCPVPPTYFFAATPEGCYPQGREGGWDSGEKRKIKRNVASLTLPLIINGAV